MSSKISEATVETLRRTKAELDRLVELCYTDFSKDEIEEIAMMRKRVGMYFEIKRKARNGRVSRVHDSSYRESPDAGEQRIRG